MNGVQVLGPKDFSAKLKVIMKAVTLVTTNELTVGFDSNQNASLTIQITGVDTAPPTISATVTPTPNGAGWNNADVTVAFTCFDKTRGIASCTPPITVTTEAAGQIVTGRATDRAGNRA